MCAQRDFQDDAHTAISDPDVANMEVIDKINRWLLCECNNVLITVTVSIWIIRYSLNDFLHEFPKHKTCNCASLQ